MISPYAGISLGGWTKITERLVAAHPVSGSEFIEVVLDTWSSIFRSQIGVHGFLIGRDIFPKPQIMGFLLHELIPLEFEARYKGIWRPEGRAAEKDLVHLPDDKFSIQIKTSSDPCHIYGNRSYAQPTTHGKKSKSGYYLTINFESCTKKYPSPKIRLIRFGWIDSDDWIGQKAATGQQSRLSPDVEQRKLITLYPTP